MMLIPTSVAQCPECGGILYIDNWSDIKDYDRDGLQGELHIGCEGEDADIENDGVTHRCWQIDWQPIFDTVVNWIIREREGAEAK